MGDIPPLVTSMAVMIGRNYALGALLMLLVGLFITMGFGDSFVSVPILAPINVSLALSTNYSHCSTRILSCIGGMQALPNRQFH